MKRMKDSYAYYTDGSCSNNGSKNSVGGWAFLKVLFSDRGLETKVMKGGKYNTTNNEMELTAFYKALLDAYRSNIKQVTIYSDSAYIVNAIDRSWVYNWNRNGWLTIEGKPVKNKTIWHKVYKLLYEEGMHVKMVKVKGHSEDVLNEYVDRMANIAKSEV